MGQNKVEFKKIWFFSHCSAEKLLETSKFLDESSFSLALIPFKIKNPDPMIKSFALLSNTKKIGAMAAMPGYVAKAEYVNMMCRTIEEFFPDRYFCLNIIEGGKDEDPSLFDIDPNLVKDENNKFIEKLLSIRDIDLMFSGESENKYQNALKYNGMQFMLLNDFKKIESDRYPNVGIRIFICVKETDQKAEDFFKEMLGVYSSDENFNPKLIQRIKDNCIIGSPSTISAYINNLKEQGLGGIIVSDLILSDTELDVIECVDNI